MFKNLKSNKGAISSIHVIIVSAIMLALLFFGLFLFNTKVKESGEAINDDIVSKFEDEDFVLSKPIELPTIDDTIDDDNDGDSSNSGDDKADEKNISITLERNKIQNREVTITLPNLKDIIEIKSSNDGIIEIVSIQGDEVKIKVKDGKVNDYVVISGSYTPGGSKTVDMQEDANYSDEYGYTGTLSRYLVSYTPEERIVIDNYKVESSTNSFPATQPYTEKGHTIDLFKKGNSIATVIKGSPSHSKSVEALDSSSYIENVMDNGIQTTYTGTLTQYVYSGQASISKTANVSQSSDIDSFPNTVSYNHDNYKGTLTKSGASIKTIVKGSANHSKTVDVQDFPNYAEPINDNGISTSYTGTLTQYVHQGSEAKTKSVTNQTSESYKENIVDNGINTSYTGTLTRYVKSGSDAGNKYVTAQVSPNYSDAEGYSGTLAQYVHSGNAPLSKYVSGQPNAWYNDGTYSGNLTQYVTSGSAEHIQYLEGEVSGGVTYLKQTFGPGYTYFYNDGTYSGNLYLISERHQHHPNGVSLSFTYDQYTTDPNDASLYNLNWDTIRNKLSQQNPAITNMRLVNMNWTTNIMSGSFVSDGVTYPYKRTANGTLTADGWEVIGLVGGNVRKPDNRTYAYAGTVWTADTRVYRYQGQVYKPDTRVYAYSGNVTKPDTRVYKYRGTVTKPDTRIYRYTQNYEGIVKTDDTRVYKYKGTVTKPDTRVYNYTQYYSGTIFIPEKSIYKYKGVVTKPATDNRVIENYYKYDLNIKYKINK